MSCDDDDDTKKPDGGTGGSTGGSGGSTGGSGGSTGGTSATGGAGGRGGTSATGGTGGSTGGTGGATGGTGGTAGSSPDMGDTAPMADAGDGALPQPATCNEFCPALVTAAMACDVPDNTMCVQASSTAGMTDTDSFCHANGVKSVFTLTDNGATETKVLKVSKTGTLCYQVEETGTDNATTITWKNGAGTVLATGSRMAVAGDDRLTMVCGGKTADVSDSGCPDIGDLQPGEDECPLGTCAP